MIDTLAQWNALVETISTMIRSVEETSRRDADRLHNDVCGIRSDIVQVRAELNEFRLEMGEMRAKLERDIITGDQRHETEIQLIKQQSAIEGNRKAKITGAILAIIGTISSIISYYFGLM